MLRRIIRKPPRSSYEKGRPSVSKPMITQKVLSTKPSSVYVKRPLSTSTTLLQEKLSQNPILSSITSGNVPVYAVPKHIQSAVRDSASRCDVIKGKSAEELYNLKEGNVVNENLKFRDKINRIAINIPNKKEVLDKLKELQENYILSLNDGNYIIKDPTGSFALKYAKGSSRKEIDIKEPIPGIVDQVLVGDVLKKKEDLDLLHFFAKLISENEEPVLNEKGELVPRRNIDIFRVFNKEDFLTQMVISRMNSIKNHIEEYTKVKSLNPKDIIKTLFHDGHIVPFQYNNLLLKMEGMLEQDYNELMEIMNDVDLVDGMIIMATNQSMMLETKMSNLGKIQECVNCIRTGKPTKHLVDKLTEWKIRRGMCLFCPNAPELLHEIRTAMSEHVFNRYAEKYYKNIPKEVIQAYRITYNREVGKWMALNKKLSVWLEELEKGKYPLPPLIQESNRIEDVNFEILDIYVSKMTASQFKQLKDTIEQCEKRLEKLSSIEKKRELNKKEKETRQKLNNIINEHKTLFKQVEEIENKYKPKFKVLFGRKRQTNKRKNENKRNNKIKRILFIEAY